VIWKDEIVSSQTAAGDTLSLAELTRSFFGEAMTMDQMLALLEAEPRVPSTPPAAAALWVGSVGYETHKDAGEFAQHLRASGVERLIDVRQLPISRRRGYAKTALGLAMAAVGIEYVHIKALGNPKEFRDLYKSGRVDEGRRGYEEHLLSQRMEALHDLVPLLREKASALMCVEHTAATCHRTVILEALREKLGLDLEVAEIS
jgi:uncharacterized protein (DUF488 family)